MRKRGANKTGKLVKWGEIKMRGKWKIMEVRRDEIHD
jgi:hypothetical protein